MKLLHEIKEQDIFAASAVVDTDTFTRRHAVRAVLVDASGRVALLHVAKRHYHKLPGGGVDKGEPPMEALHREAMEEIGCGLEVTGEVGSIIEYWDQERQIQTSDCYLAHPTGTQSSPSYTDQELAHGFEVVWAASIDDAIAILAADNPQTYDGLHIKPRDLLFLQAAKMQLQS